LPWPRLIGHARGLHALGVGPVADGLLDLANGFLRGTLDFVS